MAKLKKNKKVDLKKDIEELEIIKKDIEDTENIKTETFIENEEIIEEPIEEKIKKFIVRINYIDAKHKAIVATIGGYSKRIKIDLTFRQLEYLLDHKDAYKNRTLTIYYMGNINDAFSVKILPVKDLNDIGSR